MEFFRIKRDIPFMRHALLLNVVSFLTFAAAVFFLATRGLHLSIEFTGGTVIEVQYPQAANVAEVRETVEALGLGEVQVQTFGTSRDLLIRVALQDGADGPTPAEPTNAEDGRRTGGGAVGAAGAVGEAVATQEGMAASSAVAEKVMAALSAVDPGVKQQRVEFVGPQVGKELATDGALALGFVVVGIMIYLALRFEWKFAVSAIVANLHDVIIILGFFAFFQWEFSLSVLAAVLAVLGYSVNESVVIFDRIRESFRRQRKLGTREVIDHAITSTISRTIITHGSTQMMVLSMLIFGGATLHYFAVALTIGILFGIYSSVFVAAAVAMWLGVKREDLVRPGGKAGSGDPDDPNAGAVV